jgi:hypothetical protein
MAGLGIFGHAAIGTPHYQSYVGTRPMGALSAAMLGSRWGQFPGGIHLRDECLYMSLVSVVYHSTFHQIMRDGIKEGFDVQVDDPVGNPASFPRRSDHRTLLDHSNEVHGCVALEPVNTVVIVCTL